MAELFLSGHIVDLIVVLVALEALVLAAYRRQGARGLGLAELANMLLPGVCLLLALRGALVDAHWVWIAAFLLLSLLFHMADLRRRWRS